MAVPQQKAESMLDRRFERPGLCSLRKVPAHFHGAGATRNRPAPAFEGVYEVKEK